MENASDAIIMAGAMLIFVIAITVAMTVFSQARETVDAVVYASDETNYYEYLEINNVKNRTVGLETVIPTLYKYYKENYTVVFLDANGSPLSLYDSQTNRSSWGASGVIGKYYTNGAGSASSYDTRAVCSFDVDEEITRREPWTGTTSDYKANLDAFLNGGEFVYPSGSGQTYNYSYSFVERYSNRKFIETIGEYSTSTDTSSLSSQLNSGIRNSSKKRVIVYQLVN